MVGPDPAEPAETLPYVKCDPCIKGGHADCIGLTQPRPFCGCRCPWTETIEEDHQ